MSVESAVGSSSVDLEKYGTEEDQKTAMVVEGAGVGVGDDDVDINEHYEVIIPFRRH